MATSMVAVGTFGWWVSRVEVDTTTLRRAIFTTIQSSASITGLLSSGVSGVLLAGRVGTNSPSPCVALEMGPERGRVRNLPHTDASFNIYAYQRNPSASTVDYTVIDTLLNAVRDVLHGASLTISGVGRVQIENCAWDNYRSGDHFDERRRAGYRYDRYRVWLVLTDHYH